MDIFTIFPSWLLTAASVLFMLFLYTLRSHRSSMAVTNYKLPPNPPKLPIIGNLHKLYGKHRHEALWQLSKEYGPVMQIHIGSKPFLIISSPAMAKQVLKTHDHIFCSRPLSKARKLLTYNYMDIAFSAPSDHQKEMRRILVSELLGPKRARSVNHVLGMEIESMVSFLSSHPPNVAVNLSKLILEMVKGAVCKVAFVGGYDVFPGTVALVNAWGIGRDPSIWGKNAAEFYPERFENLEVDFEFIPFGSGRRSCPAKNIAPSTVEIVIANLLYWFDWEVPDGVKNKELNMQEEGSLLLHQIDHPYHRHEALWQLSKEYGPLMLFHIGSKPFLIISSPSMAKQATKQLTHNYLDIAFSPQSDHQREMRKILVSEFLESSIVNHLLVTEIETTVHGLELHPPNVAVNLNKLFLAIAKEIVCKVAFGKNYRQQPIKGPSWEVLVVEALEMLGGSVGDSFPWVGHFIDHVSGWNRKLATSFSNLDSYIESIVDDHKNQSSEVSDDEKDFVHGLLELSSKDDTSGHHLTKEDIKALIMHLGRECAEFYPERFKKFEVDFEMVPFGGGRRSCPAMNIAPATVEIVIANLLYLFDWEVPNGMKNEELNIKEAVLFLFRILQYTARFTGSSMTITKHPPGPQRLPIIGNLHQLVGKHRHQALWKLSQTYGPVMLLYFGSKPYIIISSSALAKQILKTNDLLFCTRPFYEGTKVLTYNYLDIAFSPYDNHWKEMRKVFVSELLGPERAGLFNDVTEMEIEGVVQSIYSHLGTVVNLENKLLALVFAVVCKVAFGKSYREEPFRGATLKEMLDEAKHMLGGSIGDHFPIIGRKLDKLSGWSDRLDKCFSNLDGYVQMVLDEHLDHGGSEISGHEKDFVHALIELSSKDSRGSGLSKDDIKALIMDVLTGGTDTIVVTMVWAMSEIVRNPRVMQKLQNEIRSCIGRKQKIHKADIMKMQYLKMVVKETLRLHSPAPLLIPRECTQHCQVGGYDVFPGTRILINAWAIGRDSRIWGDNSTEFYPERFENVEADFVGENFDMVPFGGGRRSCPAFNQAVTTVELTIANLLHVFDWEVPDGLRNEELNMEEKGSLVVCRKSSLCLVPRKYNWELKQVCNKPGQLLFKGSTHLMKAFICYIQLKETYSHSLIQNFVTNLSNFRSGSVFLFIELKSFFLLVIIIYCTRMILMKMYCNGGLGFVISIRIGFVIYCNITFQLAYVLTYKLLYVLTLLCLDVKVRSNPTKRTNPGSIPFLLIPGHTGPINTKQNFNIYTTLGSHLMEFFTIFPSWLLTTASVFFMLCMFLYTLRSNRSSITSPKLPPSPPKLPIIGHLHKLIGKTHHQALWQLSKQYGPIMLLHIGSKPFLIISSPAMAKQVLKTQDHIFCSRPLSKAAKRLTYDYLDIAFSPQSDHRKEKRKILVSEFLGPKRARSFNHVLVMEIESMVSVLSSQSSNTEVNISKMLLALVKEVVCKVGFGKNYSEPIEGSSWEEILEEAVVMLKGSLSDNFSLVGEIFDKISGWNSKLEKCFGNLDAYIQMIVDDHNNHKIAEISEDEKDFVHRLIEMSSMENASNHQLSKEDVKALIMNVFTGGIDTTVVAMEWAMSEIARSPRVMQKLQNEIRNCTGRIQKNAAEFYPERFEKLDLDSGVANFDMLPFGGGRRSCPAINTAPITVELVIANLLYWFDWELPESLKNKTLNMEEEGSLIIHKKVPLCLVPTKHTWED
ncbi:LOW QUALITY PROTEIN: hypothetical protein M8C21_011236 [Ambrosia artemisiifolia]|uniref:Cytochrome P450 n=1 Tax=Ambrosia artemisiifolia TaxID=4212 RepID=A0AAD5C7K9_AMBAR|nr:LOW QUALITY PROTEIN: hypothetical protein M8C21_011236 [Ambrosia artemisiifolia]